VTFDAVYKGYGIKVREAGGFTATVYWSVSSSRRFPEVLTATRDEGREVLLERCHRYIDEEIEPTAYGPD
jgi:hypothetical protein